MNLASLWQILPFKPTVDCLCIFLFTLSHCPNNDPWLGLLFVDIISTGAVFDSKLSLTSNKGLIIRGGTLWRAKGTGERVSFSLYCLPPKPTLPEKLVFPISDQGWLSCHRMQQNTKHHYASYLNSNMLKWSGFRTRTTFQRYVFLTVPRIISSLLFPPWNAVEIISLQFFLLAKRKIIKEI